MTECSVKDCRDVNEFTSHLTVDAYGTRWFCCDHWGDLNKFFILISKCMKRDMCRRNHNVDFDETYFFINTVKFNDKHYDLCDYHIGLYEEVLGINTMFNWD